jgi:hypothetical protein
LARAAVTLETERIKGSNPWCLWWWCVVTSKTGEQIEVQRWIVANKAYFLLLNVMKLNCINRNENKWKQQTCSMLCMWKLESVQDGGYGPWGLLIENSVTVRIWLIYLRNERYRNY